MMMLKTFDYSSGVPQLFCVTTNGKVGEGERIN